MTSLRRLTTTPVPFVLRLSGLVALALFGMSCGDQFLRIGTRFILESHPLGNRLFKKYFALCAENSITVPQVSCPKYTCFPIDFCH